MVRNTELQIAPLPTDPENGRGDPGKDPPPKRGRHDSLPLSEWADFYTDNMIVMYLPAYKQILFLKDATGTTQELYLFDIPTRSWVHGDSQFTDSVVFTNAQIDSNGNTFWLQDTGQAKKWDDTSQAPSSTALITFRDETFNRIGVKKKVYSVAIKYKASTNFSNPLEYSVDGAESWSDFGTGTLSTTTSWDTVVFEPASPVSCESIQFRLNSLSGGTIEIDDISIEYRLLPYARVT